MFFIIINLNLYIIELVDSLVNMINRMETPFFCVYFLLHELVQCEWARYFSKTLARPRVRYVFKDERKSIYLHYCVVRRITPTHGWGGGPNNDPPATMIITYICFLSCPHVRRKKEKKKKKKRKLYFGFINFCAIL